MDVEGKGVGVKRVRSRFYWNFGKETSLIDPPPTPPWIMSFGPNPFQKHLNSGFERIVN